VEARCNCQSAALALGFVLDADLSRLHIPDLKAPRRAERLWQHTCFEAFIAVEGAPGYYEFNFSPSGEWAIYRFIAYREGMHSIAGEEGPAITVQRDGDRLRLDIVIRLDRLPEIDPRAQLKLGLSAVIEEAGGKLSYWALKHPPGKPDFHHPDAFALEIEPLKGGSLS
jgi:hypothetical protein